MLPTRLASLPPPPPPPLRAYETTRMLQTMIQDIDDVPLSYFSLLFPLAPILAGRRLSTSYSSVPVAGWLSFVRLSSVSRQVVILRLSCVSCRITRLSVASCRHGIIINSAEMIDTVLECIFVPESSRHYIFIDSFESQHRHLSLLADGAGRLASAGNAISRVNCRQNPLHLPACNSTSLFFILSQNST